MSSFSLYTGVLGYGGFGLGAQEAAIVAPVYSDEGPCDNSVVERKQFQPGNTHCDGCSASKPAEWDLQDIKLFDKDKNYVSITWDSGEEWYKVTDMDGNDAGWCEWMDPDSSESCNKGIDVYTWAYYMECETTVGMTFD